MAMPSLAEAEMPSSIQAENNNFLFMETIFFLQKAWETFKNSSVLLI